MGKQLFFFIFNVLRWPFLFFAPLSSLHYDDIDDKCLNKSVRIFRQDHPYYIYFCISQICMVLLLWLVMSKESPWNSSHGTISVNSSSTSTYPSMTFLYLALILMLFTTSCHLAFVLRKFGNYFQVSSSWHRYYSFGIQSATEPLKACRGVSLLFRMHLHVKQFQHFYEIMFMRISLVKVMVSVSIGSFICNIFLLQS